MNEVKEGPWQSRTMPDGVKNKIMKIRKCDLEKIFKKLEQNAFPYDRNQRDKLLSSIEDGNQLKPEDYEYISQTYFFHINELLPKIDKEQENNWIVSVTVIYIIAGIGLRLFLIPYKQPVFLFMGVLSLLAIGLELFVLCGNINKRITTWILQSALLDEDKRALQSKCCKMKRLINAKVWIIEIIITIVQVYLYRNDLLSIGNDAISILAFGIAFFSDNVETFFVRKMETKLTEVEL